MLPRSVTFLARCLARNSNHTLLSMKCGLLQSTCTRCVATTGSLLKGHSHWQNIKHTKQAKDLEKNVLINRLILQLNKIAKANDYKLDVDGDSNLRRLMDEWQSYNLPKATLDRQMQMLQNRSFTEQTVCLVGPAGSFYVIRAMVARGPAFIQNLKRCINKVGGFRVAGESILNSFEEKAVIATSTEDLDDLEAAENLAIEIEAEEVEDNVNDDGKSVYEFISEARDLVQLQKALIKHGQNVLDAQVIFRPLYPISLSDPELQVVSKFYELLERLDEIDRVFDNIDWPSE